MSLLLCPSIPTYLSLGSHSLCLEKSWLSFCLEVKVSLDAAWKWGMGNVSSHVIFSPTIHTLCCTIYFVIMLLWGFVRRIASFLKGMRRLSLLVSVSHLSSLRNLLNSLSTHFPNFNFFAVMALFLSVCIVFIAMVYLE